MPSVSSKCGHSFMLTSFKTQVSLVKSKMFQRKVNVIYDEPLISWAQWFSARDFTRQDATPRLTSRLDTAVHSASIASHTKLYSWLAIGCNRVKLHHHLPVFQKYSKPWYCTDFCYRELNLAVRPEL